MLIDVKFPIDMGEGIGRLTILPAAHPIKMPLSTALLLVVQDNGTIVVGVGHDADFLEVFSPHTVKVVDKVSCNELLASRDKAME